MYKVTLSKEHLTILKQAFQSYFLIRQNVWREFIIDIEPQVEVGIEEFEEAYRKASPHYKDLYELICNGKTVIDVKGFDEVTKNTFLKVFKDNLNFDTLDELWVLERVIEEYMRMRMGQFFMFTDDVAHDGWEYNKDDPDNTKNFHNYINRRNEAEKMFNDAYRKAVPFLRSKTEKVLIAEDMYDVFKHQIYLDTPSMHSSYNVWSYKPMCWTQYDRPKIEVVS